MSATRRRGQPLAMLGFVLAGWVGVRASVWEPPFALPAPFAVPSGSTTVTKADNGGQTARAALPLARFDSAGFASPHPLPKRPEPPLPLAGGAREAWSPNPFAPVGDRSEAVAVTVTPPRVAAAHQLLYLAALGRLPLPPGLGLAASPRPTAPPPLLAAAASRWSGDAWVLMREDPAKSSGGLAAASGFPSYGASQAGGVLRYALAPGSSRAPQAYLRLSRAIGGFDEAEAAVGLSARPLATIPLRLLAEARVQRGSGGTRVRPAASLISELPPVRLPLGGVGEAYAQAGYVGGKRGATPFFDVQAIADRALARTGPAELRVGAGTWSGGQKGATRLDLGPRASLRLDTAPARSRLAIDWRFRVAGNARPASGPTLTFSAGF